MNSISVAKLQSRSLASEAQLCAEHFAPGVITAKASKTPAVHCSLSLLAGLAMLLLCTSALADNHSPSTVNGISGQAVSESSTLISWNKPWDDVGVDGYNIYRDSAYYATVFQTSFTDDFAIPGSTHDYQITAFDAARRYSPLSESVRVTMPSAEIAPVVQSTAAEEQQTSSGNSVDNNNAGNTSTNAAPSIPYDLRGTEVAPGTVKWEWSWLPDATQYEVTIDGLWAGLTEDTQFFSQNLWVGDHSLSVKSVNADWQYSAPSETKKVYVTGNSANNSVAPPAPEPANDPQPPTQTQTQTQDLGPDNGMVDPQSWVMPNINRDGYDLVFSDEFNGNQINGARWDTNLRWDGEFNGERYEYRIINNEDQFYISPLSADQEHKDVAVNLHNPFEFNGDRLAIRAIRNPAKTSNSKWGHGPLRDMLSQQTFLSGALSTHDKFWRKYGYFEARIKIPSHVGTFPAFWLYHKNRKWEGTYRTEIDIMENLGHAPWYIYNSMHYFDNVSAQYQGDANFIRPEPEGQIYTGIDYSQNYHVYAVQWEPGYVKWMIDGEKTSEAWHWSANNEDLYLMLNLAMGGNWTNFPTNAGGLGRADWERFPNANDLATFNNPALEIDYVRVYAPK